MLVKLDNFPKFWGKHNKMLAMPPPRMVSDRLSDPIHPLSKSEKTRILGDSVVEELVDLLSGLAVVPMKKALLEINYGIPVEQTCCC